MVRITSSVRPRVFMSMPSARAWRGGTPWLPSHRGADELPDAGGQDDEHQVAEAVDAEAGDVDVEAGDHEEDREQEQDRHLLEPFEDLVEHLVGAFPGNTAPKKKAPKMAWMPISEVM